MARYIDADQLLQSVTKGDFNDLLDYIIFQYFVEEAPEADVVPKSEVERLEREVKLLTENTITAKYSHCVIGSYYAVLTKSLEDYEKVIADISSAAKAEVAREIFADIWASIATHAFTAKSEDYEDGAYDTIEWVDSKIAEVEKKYTEGESNGSKQ